MCEVLCLCFGFLSGRKHYVAKPHQPAADPALKIKALDYINDGVMIADGEGRLIYMDPSMKRMLPPGKEFLQLSDLPPLSLEAGPITFAEIVQQTQAGGAWTGAATLAQGEQHSLFLDLRGQRLAGAHGGVILVARDITREHSMEKQVLLSQQMELVEAFIGGMAHEFKNLLTVLMAYATLLKDQLKGQSCEEDVGKILETAQKANELTSRIMAVARPAPLRMENLDLFGVLNDLLATLRKTLPHTIELTVPEVRNLPRIYGDPSVVYRALLNLCINARDAMPQGGRLTLGIDWICLDQEDLAQWPERHPGVYMILAVTDTGTGMAPEVKDRIFEPFFTTKPGGTGLGLSVVEYTLKSSGAWITAASQPGKGSCFRIYLPAAHQENVFLKDEGEDLQPAEGTETLLVVDDDPVILSLARHYLQKSGFTVWTASTGEEALKLFHEHAGEIRLVVLDVMMPGMNGEQLYKELTHLRPGGLPVLVVSGFPLESAERLLQESGAPLLKKPFSRARLTREIRRLLDAAPAAS